MMHVAAKDLEVGLTVTIRDGRKFKVESAEGISLTDDFWYVIVLSPTEGTGATRYLVVPAELSYLLTETKE